MKITTWNCARTKRDRILPEVEGFKSDFVLLQEIAKPAVETPAEIWIGQDKRQGLSVISCAGAPLKIATEYSQTLHYALPVEIGGKQPFQILAIWMLKEPVHYAPNLVAILEHYREFLARGPTVIAGDFNANPKFDAQHKHYLFETITAKFDELGLCSAYHECTGEAHGAETQPTFYFRRHRNRPFHIDYLLCPKPWRSKLGEITVGSYEAFAGLSDHRPITAQFTV